MTALKKSQAYHADHSAVSHSMLEVFKKSIPKYHKLYVKEEPQSGEPSDAMRVGSAMHAATLFPKDTSLLIMPPGYCRTKAAKEAKTGLEKKAVDEGLILVSDAEATLCFGMSSAILADPVAAALLDNVPESMREYVCRWTDPAAAIECKLMMDAVTMDGFILDLKSAIDPSPAGFARACANFGYDRQAAWYLDGVNQYTPTGISPTGFVFIVVGSEPPHEVGVYQLSSMDLDRARDCNARLLAELADCYALDTWDSRLSRAGMQTIYLPAYAYSKE
jgi:hypothetical protein